MAAVHQIDPISLIEDRLRSHGRKVTRSGDKLNAQCPAHDDKSPSLSAGVGASRDVVVYCHAGCRPDDVLAALDLKWTDFGDGSQRETPTTTWVYKDANGRPLYRVAKYPGKKFRQHAYDPMTGEWLPRLGSVDRVPYRLPEIVEAIDNGDTIWIAEGEKDVDALVAAGVVATCNSGGAGKFTEQVARHFRGAEKVVIVADNDETGREHAHAVAALLDEHDVPAEIVRAAEGKDAYDHFAFGRTIEEFVPLKDDDELAEDTTDDYDAALLSMLIDWRQFFDTDHQAEDWLWEPVIPAGRGTVIFAKGGTGKSLVLLAMVVDLVKRGVRVLYLDYEMTPADLDERLADMGVDAAEHLESLFYAQLPSLPAFDTPEGGRAVTRFARLVDAQLVVIDTFARAVQGEENDSDTVRDFYRMTGLHLKADGRAFIRIDHSGKDEAKGQRGSSAKNDDVDLVWQLKLADDGYTLVRGKCRMGWVPERVALERHERPFGVSVAGGDSWEPGTKECVELLDELEIHLDWGERRVIAAVVDAGHDRPLRKVLRDALKYRRKRSSTFHFVGDEANAEREKSAPSNSRRGVSGKRAEIDSAHLSGESTKDQVDGCAEGSTARSAHPPAAEAAQCASLLEAQCASGTPETPNDDDLF